MVTVPLVVPMMLARLLPVPVPPRVKPNVAPVIVPVLERMMSPGPETILLALPSVIYPLYVAAVLELIINAPPLETPVPLIVGGSAVTSVNPFRSSAAPVAETVVPAAVVPSGLFAPLPAAPNLSVPALIVVKPV